MCLPNLIEYKQIEESNPIIGYRTWRNIIDPKSDTLMSEYMDYKWSKLEGPHEIKEQNSGIYAYNYNNNYYYNNYNNYYYNNYYYYISGIIKQWGKVAIHKTGQRSEYAKIDTLFNMRILDAQGSNKFISWIKNFNSLIDDIAERYECKVIS